MPWTVYCHTHVESGRRYVGITKRTMWQRWSQHCAQAKSSKGGRWHFPNAIRKYGKDAFSHQILEVCASLEEANRAEDAWICSFTTRDPVFGFNLAPGGTYTPCSSGSNPWDDPAFRAARLADLARANAITFEERSNRSKGIWSNLGFKDRMSAISKISNGRPETKERQSLAKVGKKLAPEHVAKMVAAHKGKKVSKETRLKISEALKGRVHSPEVRAKNSVAQRGRVLNSETRAKISEATRRTLAERGPRRQSEESRQKISDKLRLFFAAKKSRPTDHEVKKTDENLRCHHDSLMELELKE